MKLLTLAFMTAMDNFAQEWIAAWNSHDLDRIMEHYSEQIDFRSPVIRQIGFNEEGIITDKAKLRKYFEKGLQAYPDLRFELEKVLEGLDSVVLYYQSINNKHTAEYMELDASGKVKAVRAHYG